MSVSVTINFDSITAVLDVDEAVPLMPPSALLAALVAADGFPEELGTAINACLDGVCFEIDCGAETFMELGAFCEQYVPVEGVSPLSLIATEGAVTLRITPNKSVLCAMDVLSKTGGKLGSLSVPGDATGARVHAALADSYTGDMQLAAIEIPPKVSTAKWITLNEPFGEASIVSMANAMIKGLIVFVRPPEVTSIAQLRVRLPIGSVTKIVAGAEPAVHAHPVTPTVAGGKPNSKGKDKPVADAQQDAARAAAAPAIQHPRTKQLATDGSQQSIITFLGGGKWLCNICDSTVGAAPTAAPPKPRALGEGCAGIPTHLHKRIHIQAHATLVHGQELAEAEVLAIMEDVHSKSYGSKRDATSARAVGRRIDKIAKLGLDKASPVVPAAMDADLAALNA